MTNTFVPFILKRHHLNISVLKTCKQRQNYKFILMTMMTFNLFTATCKSLGLSGKVPKVGFLHKTRMLISLLFKTKYSTGKHFLQQTLC